MKIHVQFSNKTYGIVSDSDLQEMLDNGSIIAFRRADGWVDIDAGPLRGKENHDDYAGPERRLDATSKSCLTCTEFVNSACKATYDCPIRSSLQGKIK